MLLKEKNIVITGSGRGIGKHIAIECAKEGANIGITSRTLEELNFAKEEVKKINPNVKVVVKTADITNYSEVEELFNYYHEQLGDLNGVISNAGISGRYDTHKFTPDKFAKIIDVNINGVFYTFKAAYHILKKDDKKDKARFIISGSAAYPNAMPKFTAYTASKYAVVGFQRSVALEYRRENINFNTVLPTMVDTQLLRGDKAGDGNAGPGIMDPEEIPKYYIFLLSEDGNRVSDDLIFVNEFEQLIGIIKESSEELRTDWDTFKVYLEENHKNVYDNIRKQWRLAKFLLERIK